MPAHPPRPADAASVASIHGPYATAADARCLPVARDPALSRQIRHDHLTRAVAEAGVTLGAFDAEIVAWLARTWEPETVAVLAGLVTRAHAAGRTAGARLITDPAPTAATPTGSRHGKRSSITPLTPGSPIGNQAAGETPPRAGTFAVLSSVESVYVPFPSLPDA